VVSGGSIVASALLLCLAMRHSKSSRREFEAQALPHLDALYGTAMRLCRNPDDAHDLVQETYLRAWGAWDRFIAGSNCRAWLVRILTNSYINGYRRGRSHKRFAQRPGDEPAVAFYGQVRLAQSADPERALTEPMLGDEVQAALGELTEEYRAVVVLADLEGMKYKEIAEALGCPVGTVMSRLFRARRQLEERLGPYAAETYGVKRAA
jgi:RNA polymerase sigma-70 factor (ECF subfamily)